MVNLMYNCHASSRGVQDNLGTHDMKISVGSIEKNLKRNFAALRPACLELLYSVRCQTRAEIYETRHRHRKLSAWVFKCLDSVTVAIGPRSAEMLV
ncbi:MAG: hypothetical protein LBR80_14490 [Deltaproteobacteria bacterium]|jgi:hypothetical protein|nr:hypothetical protein [Deltaproteobacteria bacterium]